MVTACFDNANSLFNFVVKEGNGVKGMVDSGLSKVPERYIQPLQERIDKTKAWCSEQPPIDISGLDGPDHDKVVEALVRASETVGFFQVVNHGVPVELLETLKEKAHRFFSQPPEKKGVYRKGASPTPLVRYGTSFAPLKEEALEWKDYLSLFYSTDEEALQNWPEEFKESCLEYLQKSAKMVKRILGILFDHLGVKVEDSKVDDLIGFKMINMNFYPPCPNPDLTVGVGRHSDMGMLTVLLQDGIGGLYVKVEEDINDAIKKGEWMEIPPLSGALVLNVGDTLQILSNGRYKSVEHRVRTTSKTSRVSVPVFTIPRPTEKIAPFPELVERDGVAHYREYLVKDYMENFFGKAHRGKEQSLDFAHV